MKTIAELRQMIEGAQPCDGDDPSAALRRLADVQLEVATVALAMIDAMRVLGNQLAHNDRMRAQVRNDA